MIPTDSRAAEFVILPGLQTLNYALPDGVSNGIAYARVRLSSQGGLLPTGLSIDGEVEDYQIEIGPPRVRNVIINNDEDQRSSLDHLRIEFDREVDVDNADENTFQVFRTDTNEQVIEISSLPQTAAGRTFIDLTFDASGPSVTDRESLADGHYRLVVDVSKITSYGVPVAANGVDGQYRFGDGDPVDAFFRKYGDITGDDQVQLNDFARFRASFGLTDMDAAGVYEDGFDSDGNGIIDLADFAAFRANFGT